MKVFIVIVTYNGMRWYKNCFNSVRNSTIPLTPIVIDNNSSDNTISFLKENFPEVHLIGSKENLGFGKANNIGIKYAIEQNADYIYLLNQDAWIKENTIEKLVHAAIKQPEFGIISPIHLSKDEKNIDYNQMYHLAPIHSPELAGDIFINNRIEDKIYEIDFVNAAHWLITKDCINMVGGFSSLFFLYGEDNNYIHRAKNFGFRIGIYPKSFAIHDRGERRNTELPFKKKWSIENATCLQMLANIQSPISYCLKGTYSYIFSNLINNIIYLKGKNCILYTLLPLKIFISLNKVRIHRNISRLKKAYLK